MLLGLDVLPEYRRQGLATEIVFQYLRRELERDRQLLILTCLKEKVKMYEKMGFSNRGIAESSWGDEEWYELCYALNIKYETLSIQKLPTRYQIIREGVFMENKRKHTNLLLWLLVSCLFFLLSGCRNPLEKTDVSEEAAAKSRIVLLGKESYVYSDEGFLNGIEMALQELAEDVSLSWEHMDDQGDFETGLLYGSQLAADDSVLAVLTFQDFDVIDALAPVFEENQKPLISVQGCYERTLNKGYNYFLSDFTSANDMGRFVADYCSDQGYQRLAGSHTGTEFELEEMRGFLREAQNQGIKVVDMIQGPTTMPELKALSSQWEKLGVEVVYLAHYTYSDTSWMIQMIEYLKQQNPKLQIMSDYSLNQASTLEQYGDILEGVVIPAPYSVAAGEQEEIFRRQYQERYEMSASNMAVQGYDLIQMIGNILHSGYTNSEDFMQQMKSKEGYQGITGTIRFEENGKLGGIAPQYLIVKEGRFVTDGQEVE